MPLEHRETQDWLSPGGPICLRPNPSPHHFTHPLSCSVLSVVKSDLFACLLSKYCSLLNTYCL
uniref:Uncharacterized protein n=1 Tax=Mesocestoides corti TaxID=53468 RepID=A0A5K3FVC5_MESCO